MVGTAARPNRITIAAPRSKSPGSSRLVAGALAVGLVLALLLVALGTWLGSLLRPPTPPVGAPAAPGPETPAPRDPAAAAGVRTDWPRDREGAVGAATAYLSAVSSRAYLRDRPAREAVVRAVVDPRQVEQVLASSTSGEDVPPGSPFAAAFADPRTSAWRYVPVGYHVDAYDADRAVVSVWALQLAAGVGSTSVPATATWGTTSVPLRWLEADGGHGWRLDVAGMRGTPGPTPASPAGALSSDLDVIAADRGFRGYDNAGR